MRYMYRPQCTDIVDQAGGLYTVPIGRRDDPTIAPEEDDATTVPSYRQPDEHITT
jgi:hypothetical protein